ncbi:MAG: ABC transporter ATP-binding protein [Clostridia bacterium]|nr:ABC transporter ATP-binding protein [Clostridia bacterium]
MTAIKTAKLTKKYKGVTAVDGLDLEISEGELFALLGVNGAGKTTTVRMLSTLSAPTEGDAEVCGFPLTKDADKIRPLIDVSMQETAVARKLTVEENVAFYAELCGQSKEEALQSRDEVFASFGLGEVAKRQAGKLSGGWQRKLSIALALVSKPKVLFLDEPTLGLDVLARRELWKTISSLKGKMTIILTTHYMEEAQALADRIGVMAKGKLLFCGTKEELYENTNKNSVEEAFVFLAQGGDAND